MPYKVTRFSIHILVYKKNGIERKIWDVSTGLFQVIQVFN